MASQPGGVPDFPLRLGTPEQFAALRSALRDLGYDAPTLDSRRRSGGSGSRPGKPELNDALDAVISLLTDGDVLPEDRLRELAPAGALEALETLGVIEKLPDPKRYYATVLLYPILSVYVVSDRANPVDASEPRIGPDYVYPAFTWNSQQFLSCLPQSSCERMLDLGAGSGVAALIGSSSATHVWACDLNERCVHFAEFSRRLNGIANVTCLGGDLFEPVRGLTFDRIVSHPPYMPAYTQSLLYSDGGEDGEQILRRIVTELPGYLNSGGRFYCFVLTSDRRSGTFEQRVRRWLGERETEFDVISVVIEMHKRHEPPAPGSAPRRDVLVSGDQEALFLKLEATAIYYTALVIERVASGRRGVTSRTQRAGGARSEAVEWFVNWTTSAAAPNFGAFLLESRPRLASHLSLEVTHSVMNGSLSPSRFVLRSDYPFSIAAPCPAWIATAIGACDGTTTVREIFEELGRGQLLPAGLTMDQFAANVGEMVARGFLELEKFKLPKPTDSPFLHQA